MADLTNLQKASEWGEEKNLFPHPEMASTACRGSGKGKNTHVHVELSGPNTMFPFKTLRKRKKGRGARGSADHEIRVLLTSKKGERQEKKKTTKEKRNLKGECFYAIFPKGGRGGKEGEEDQRFFM